MKFYTNVHLHKNDLLVTGYENGERFKEEVRYTPYLFVVPQPSEEKHCTFHTVRGKPVRKIVFNDIYSAKNYIRDYGNKENSPIFGLHSFVHTYINDHYKEGMPYDASLLSIVNIDIETSTEGGFPNIETADKPIISIAMSKNNKMAVFGLREYQSEKDNVIYIKCDDEADLLNKFLKLWSTDQWMPDIVTGWNVEAFDMPYMVRRIERILGPESVKRLSPWKLLSVRKFVTAMGNELEVFTPVGMTVLDYMLLYKKFSYSPQESYALNHIAMVELGEKKLDYSEYESMHDFYIKNFKKFIDYNIHDVHLVNKLEEKLGFIKQVIAIGYDAKVNFIDTMTTVRIWDVIIHNYLLNQNIVIPPIDPNRFSDGGEIDEKIEGAHVKDPIPAMYEWVASFDLDSLYPHLIMQYNISPETFAGKAVGITVEHLLNGKFDEPMIRERMETHNVTYAATGSVFVRDRKGFLPALMEKFYADRSQWKKRMIEAKIQYEKTPTKELEYEIARCKNMQMAKKILLNSAYGALANKAYRWFQRDLAESITVSGQLTIRWAEKRMNEYMNKVLKTDNHDYIIAIDTDSMYVHLGPLVDKIFTGERDTAKIVEFVDKLCNKELSKVLDSAYDDLAKYMNAYQQKMRMKREAIADKGIWTGKKHYILNVYDLEGVRYKEPQLKMQGIEAVRSSTPAVVREAIKKSLELIMTTDEQTLKKYVQDFKQKFRSLPYEEVAFPRGCKELRKWSDNDTLFKKGCPIHVRGALIHNYLVKQKNLEKRLPLIRDNDKIKFCYLLTPNPVMQNVIATLGAMPKEFDLNTYIDYDTQLEKAYGAPLQTILDIIGWNVDDRVTIEDFFA